MVKGWLWFAVGLTVSSDLMAEEGGSAEEERPSLSVNASYLSARLRGPKGASEGYLSVDGLSLGGTTRAWQVGAWSFGGGGGALVWREGLRLTPSANELRPLTPEEGEGSPSYPTLSRPAQVTLNEAWVGLMTANISTRWRSSQRLWPSVTAHLGGLWRAQGGAAQPSSREGVGITGGAFKGRVSPWLSAQLHWSAPARLLSPWLYGRWGGGSLGTELMSERSAAPLIGNEVAVGLSVGRAAVSLSWQPSGARQGVAAGLTLPLSAPLYLCSAAWFSEGQADRERAFSVGLRWTGEEVLRELPPPAGDRPASSAPGLPTSPGGSSAQPRRGEGGLSPLSPLSPPSTPGSGGAPSGPL